MGREYRRRCDIDDRRIFHCDGRDGTRSGTASRAGGCSTVGSNESGADATTAHGSLRFENRRAHLLWSRHITAGVVLARSTGDAACLLGKTWGYDDTGIWVSDGLQRECFWWVAPHNHRRRSRRSPEDNPQPGFLLYEGEQGRDLAALRLCTVPESAKFDSTYVDYFGNTKTIQLRHDVQLQKFFAPFSGWFLTPKVPVLPLRLVLQFITG
jgi:hypothetical protein